MTAHLLSGNNIRPDVANTPATTGSAPEAGGISVTAGRAKHLSELMELRALLFSGAAEGSPYAAGTAAEARLWRAAFRSWCEELFLRPDPKVRIAVVEQPDGRLAGCAIGVIDQRAPSIDVLSGRTGWIQGVVVRPEQRGRGIAGALISDLESWFMCQNAAKIHLQSTAVAESLYAAGGYLRASEPALYKVLQLSANAVELLGE